jgi:hypothetical protein
MKKKFFVFLAAFLTLGCVMPSVVATAQTSGTLAANACVLRTGDGKPCTPAPKPAAGKHNKKHVAPAANQQQPAPPPAAPSPVDKLAELLVASQVQLNTVAAANLQRETDAFVLAQIALKLQADTDAARVANEKDLIAHNYELDLRRVKVEELDQTARAEYYKVSGKAQLRDSTAHVLDATLGNVIRAGGQIGAAVLMQPTQVTATGGGGGNAAASQSQVQQQTASPSQSQSQVAP